MNLWIGEVLVQTGIDWGRWSLALDLFFRMRFLSAQVGPFYVEVSY